ncbi:hypothetical protein PHLH5_31780 [Pseudomonas sp. Cab53]|nr:hypothetical protein PHLH5_31780 [Pseudomonas sp. Cab53]
MGNVQSAASALEVFRRPAPRGELLELGRVLREPLGLSRLHSTPKRVLSRREGVLLGFFALVLHGAVIVWVRQAPSTVLPVVPPQIPPMTIEFSQPAPRWWCRHRPRRCHRQWSSPRRWWRMSWL